METTIALEGPVIDLAAHHAGGTTETTAPSPQQPQAFEWIPHGDASARKRARAHVTRGFRRQKAAQAQLLKGGNLETSKVLTKSSSVSSQESAITAVVKTVTAAQPCEEEDVDASAKALIKGIILQRSMGSDPFAAFPVRLSPEKKELLDHFFFGLAPLSFAGDNRADFQPVKKLVFNMGLLGASGFHVILSAAANDIAAMRGMQDSEDSIMHQRIAIGLVNKRLSEWRPDSSNEGLASVALLAGLELLFGTPETVNTHMDGLAIMLELRGGLQSVQATDPQVYAIISWFDYAASCNLVCRRRFALVQEHLNLLYTPPEGVPEKILSHLPAGYDLHKELMSTFSRMHTMTAVLRSRSSTDAQRLELSDSVSRIDAALYQSICMPFTEGNRSRRRHIQQSLYILTLVYTSLVSEYEGPQTEIFIYRFEKIWDGESREWGEVIIRIFRSLLIGENFGSEVLMYQIAQLIDLSVTLGWVLWRHIKEVLLNYFVYDLACHGQLQELWKGRLEPVSPLLEIG